MQKLYFYNLQKNGVSDFFKNLKIFNKFCHAAKKNPVGELSYTPENQFVFIQK
jgi:hypothetical protein